ncbi:hypothetical protein V9T40_005789 [Parthenolecanium corni]|uniref:Serpin domain-containing protein n=1 Tax=Parthenolecanium corni TaxID=536013 RepID=A0AAN9TUU6_9HEMI
MGQEAASQLASMPLLLQTQQPQILQAQAEPSNIYSNDICQVIRESMACFAVTTASKIMKSKDMEEDKNIFFSPLDLYTATALTYIGSDGEARRRLGKILGIKEPRPNVHSRRRRQQPRSLEDIYRTIGAVVNQSRDSNLAAIQYGAGVYVYNDYAIKSTYIEDARNYFGIEVKCTDFKAQNVASTELINK